LKVLFIGIDAVHVCACNGAWFRRQVHDQGGGNYQTLINLALREHITREDGVLAETLRRVLREEMATYAAPVTSRSTRTSRKRAGG